MLPERIKIAFIEDNELLLENYVEYFESDEKFSCIFAYGSIIALKEATKTERLPSPDLVLLDIQLPEVNGIEGIAIINKGECTLESPDLFSYRRDGVTGRQAGVISL